MTADLSFSHLYSHVAGDFTIFKTRENDLVPLLASEQGFAH